MGDHSKSQFQADPGKPAPKPVKLFAGNKKAARTLSRQQAKIVALYYPALKYFRSQRLRRFYSRFDITDSTRIIDIGGNLFFWRLAMEMQLPRAQVTVVNLDTPRASLKLPENVKWIYGDGTHLKFEDKSFDIAFCNSVIEHLGDRRRQEMLVGEINRVAPYHFVQTPNRTFIFEPHMMAFFEHWLPLKWKKLLMRNFTGWGLIQRPSRQQCDELLKELCLLSVDEMNSLFPESDIVPERFLGMTKSMVAIKAPDIEQFH